jgi:hypothetical protein
MLWYKSWLETRWRFVIGFAVLFCSAAATVLTYPQVARLASAIPVFDAGGEVGRRIRESLDLARDYRGYVWSQWFRQNGRQLCTLFAILLGTGGLISRSPDGGTLFTLALPVSRMRLFTVRAVSGLGQLLALALVPAIAIAALSPAVGERYALVDALVHASCLFVAGTVFYSLAVVLSTAFGDLWRPALIGIALAVALAVVDEAAGPLQPYSVFHVMSGEAYFRTGRLPWLGLMAAAAASSALLYGAAVTLDRHDF